MNTKHTPGPWSVIEQDVIGSPDPSIGIGSVFPADKSGDGFKYGEVTKANARLIAAAPDLYRELQHLARCLHPWIEAGHSVPGIATLNGAFAAINKATGERA